MTDEDVEMKRRFIVQARPPADSAWTSDHIMEGASLFRSDNHCLPCGSVIPPVIESPCDPR